MDNQVMKVGIIKEGKNPPDSRVVLTPDQCVQIQKDYGLEIVVQESESRCFSDATYSQKGIKLVKNVDDCDILIGVKEVPIEQLIPNKTYSFFSHTIKAQPYNQDLLKAILDKNIRLIDYEVLTNNSGQRVIAFGRFAGMVGAHNGLMTYGMRTGAFALDRMTTFDRYTDAITQYNGINFPPLKVVVSGNGRVANGACEVLDDMGFTKVSPEDYKKELFAFPAYTQLPCEEYAKPINGGDFDKEEFYQNPSMYEINFDGYSAVSDIFINGIYWDPRAPAFFSREEMQSKNFRIKVIADVTCDIAPEASIPSTIRPSTIAEPIYGYDPMTGFECDPFMENSIDIMAVDNLPNELPKDASESFGEQFMEHVLPNLLEGYDNPMIEKASIAIDGDLGPHFEYLRTYVSE